jgi:hypothetical protein
MRTTLLFTRILMRASILILLVLGLLFWTGHALALVPLHMAFGLLLVLGLWVIVGLAASRGAPLGLVIAAGVWGLLVLGLGMTQAQLLPGPAHWVIRMIHLLVGLATMGFAERVAVRFAAALAGPAGATA